MRYPVVFVSFCLALSQTVFGVSGSVHGDYLYWTAMSSNLVYSSEKVNVKSSNQVLGNQTKKIFTRSLNPHYHSGYRVGAGYDVPCSPFGVAADWTQFNTCASVDCGTSACWKLNLKMFDFVMGADWCFDECFALRGSFGLRYARIQQDYQAKGHTSIKGSIDQVLLTGSLFAKDCEDHLFNGAGPRIDLDLEAFLYPKVTLWGNAAFSFLVGSSSHRVNACSDGEVFWPFAVEASERTTNKQRFVRCESRQANRPVTDLALGLRFSPYSRVHLQVAFEHHCFFWQKNMQFNQLVTPLRNCSNTFAVYGVSVSGNVCF